MSERILFDHREVPPSPKAERPETGLVERPRVREASPLKGVLKGTSREEQQKIADYVRELRAIGEAQQQRTDTEPGLVTVTKEPIVTAHASLPSDEGSMNDSGTWDAEFVKYMRKKQQGKVERVYKESMRQEGFQRHIFLSDYQIPDHDPKTIKAVNKFIKDFAPDKVHLVGDFLNFTAVAKYDQDPYYHKGMADEIKIGRQVLGNLVTNARNANPESEVLWYEGNHESRLIKYMGRNASALAEITDEDGEIINSIPHIFNLAELGVEWVPSMQRHSEPGGVEVEHGDVARGKSGHTAHAMLDKRGKSGFSGHTHRLAMIFKTQMDDQKFWVETGSMCKQNFESPYARTPDWQQGFAVGVYSDQDKTFYPSVVPVFDNKFMFGGKVYKP
jgi:hypothetical protein